MNRPVTSLVLACCLGTSAQADFWQITVVDSGVGVGAYCSLAVLPSGQPAISYYPVHKMYCLLWFLCYTS